MKVSNREELKTQLLGILRPRTEADPDVLGDYIVALLENHPDFAWDDGPAVGLFHQIMTGKLEDFLTNDTGVFVSELVALLSGRPVARGMEPVPEQPQYRPGPVRREQQRPGVCNDWKRGQCRRGPSCRYAHPPPAAPYTSAAPPRPSTRLVVDRIPAEFISIAAIHEAFARFGTIVNIDLAPELGRARLQYSTPEAAKAAFDCPEVFFNNRFVAVSWDRNGGETVSIPLGRQGPPQYHYQQRPYVDPQAELLQKRKETLDAFLDLQKQKEALLARYTSERNRIAQALSSPDLDGAARAASLAELQVIEKAIEGVKPPKAAPATPILRGGPPPKIPSHFKLDLRSGNGVDATSAATPTQKPQYKLDLRPRTLRMSPLPAKIGSDPSSIRKFFEAFGQVADLTVSDDHALVTFLTRPDAERALLYLTKAEPETTFAWHSSEIL